MKKTLLFVIIGLSVLNFATKAQILGHVQPKKIKGVMHAKPFAVKVRQSVLPSGAPPCDTVNLDSASTKWHAYTYGYGDNGFLFGTINSDTLGFQINENANYFDVSADNYSYVSGGLVYFSVANSNVDSDLNKNIIFKVYDDEAGTPNNLLGSTTVTLSQVHQDVLNGYLTQFVFSSPIAIPASKTFYISIDLSNFAWTDTTKDSIAIVADSSGEAPAAAYQYLVVPGEGEGWLPVNQVWEDQDQNPLDINLFIFPYVSNSADGCAILPVTMFNFGGQVKDYKAYLNWSTAAENNNKGFYIERSKDAQNFEDIGFVKSAGNSNKVTNYNYTDISLKDMNVTTTYYRLKQVDVDGKFTYSKVLALNLNNTTTLKFYPNPVQSTATVELNLNTASKVNVQVISRDGKVVLNADKGVLTQGTQQVSVNAQSLAAGTYIIRVTTGDKTYSQLFIKE